jgi:hypothetical protein
MPVIFSNSTKVNSPENYMVITFLSRPSVAKINIRSFYIASDEP